MLTQSEADGLITMRKEFSGNPRINLGPGVNESHELIGETARELFLLDIWQGTIRLSKVRLQNRARTVFVLVRVDIDGAPHTNPDGARIGGSHIHLYREGFEDKWAFALDPGEFRNTTDMVQVFRDFCRRCNIVGAPPVQGRLL